jgi:hypothetical protein
MNPESGQIIQTSGFRVCAREGASRNDGVSLATFEPQVRVRIRIMKVS